MQMLSGRDNVNATKVVILDGNAKIKFLHCVIKKLSFCCIYKCIFTCIIR